MVLLGKYPLLWELPRETMQRRLRKQTAVKQAPIMLGRSKVSFKDWQTPAQRDRVLAWLLNLCKCERKCQKLLKISPKIISTFLFGVIKSKNKCWVRWLKSVYSTECARPCSKCFATGATKSRMRRSKSLTKTSKSLTSKSLKSTSLHTDLLKIPLSTPRTKTWKMAETKWST